MNLICVNNSVKDIDSVVLDSNSLIVMSHGLFDRIDLVGELEGQTNTLKDLTLVSYEIESVIVAGIEATILDDTFLSAIVIDKGNILGISDMTHTLSGDYTAGNSLRIYDTSMGSIGLVIGDDIFFPEITRSIALAGADYIVYLANKDSTRKAMISSSHSSMANGLFTIAQTLDKTSVFDCYGKMIIRDSNSTVKEEIEPIINDNFISARREEVYTKVYVEGKT